MKSGKKLYLTKEDIENFNYVKVKNPKIKLDNFPDFLVIGPQRTGTSWLHSNLEKNPEIFMSDPKETHYFAILSGSNKKNIIKGFRPNISYYLDFFDENKSSSIHKLLKILRESETTKREILLRGESSATYASINKEAINDILILNPDIKILMLVRNPIERVWSHLKLELIYNPQIPYSKRNRYKDISKIPEEEIINFINIKYIIDNSFFSKIIEKWHSTVKKENFFYGNFNDIGKQPSNLLKKVHDFLEINYDESLFEKEMRKKINNSIEYKIPNKIKILLEDRYNDEIDLLRGKYGVDI